jgi:hypothetical protein
MARHSCSLSNASARALPDFQCVGDGVVLSVGVMQEIVDLSRLIGLLGATLPIN